MDDSPSDGFKLSIFASVNIKKGSPILFNYVKPLDPTPVRQDCLKTFKNFVCHCQRCQDPRELGTLGGALLCQACNSGPVLACQDDGLPADTHVCQDCSEILEIAKVRFVNDEVAQAKRKLANAQARADLAASRQIYEKFRKVLYPSHGFLNEIRQVNQLNC